MNSKLAGNPNAEIVTAGWSDRPRSEVPWAPTLLASTTHGEGEMPGEPLTTRGGWVASALYRKFVEEVWSTQGTRERA